MSAVTKSQLNHCPPIHNHIGLTPYGQMGPPLGFNGHLDRRKKLKLSRTVPSFLGRGGEVGVCHLLVD